MKILLANALLLLPLTALAANPRSIVLTLQDTGRALVSETHDIPPPGQDGVSRIAPVPETILPTSVHAVPIERGETLDILSQRFAYDLRDSESLFHAYLGKSITVKNGSETHSGRLATAPDFSRPSAPLMLASDGQPVRYFPNVNELDSVEFPAQADLDRVPTLLWQTPPGQSPPMAAQLHYAADGLSWSAAHEGILAADGRSMVLSTRVLLVNATGREFANARVRLALTDRGRHTPLVPDPGDPRANRAPVLRYSADGTTWVPERVAASAATVAHYDLPHPLTLPAGGELRAGLSQHASLPVETRFIYDGVRFDRYQRNRRTDWTLGTEYSPAVETRLVFRNDPSSPLPPGEFRLLRGAADRPMEWVGTDWLPSLAPGESATLNLGPAAGLSGRRLRTGYAEVVPFKVSDESFEILLDNQTGADQTITVVEHLYRSETFEITAANAEHRPGEVPNSIVFDIPVRAGTQRSTTYTVRYTW
jgi:hypothetical protein